MSELINPRAQLGDVAFQASVRTAWPPSVAESSCYFAAWVSFGSPGPTTVAGARGWTPEDNAFGWRSYLGSEPGIEGVSAYAAPARRENLSGLPPTSVTVGTADLFHDEVVHYAHRLQSAGVSTRLEIIPGAFHGFEIARGLHRPCTTAHRCPQRCNTWIRRGATRIDGVTATPFTPLACGAGVAGSSCDAG